MLKVKLNPDYIIDELNKDVDVSASAKIKVISPYFRGQCRRQNRQEFHYKDQLLFACKPYYKIRHHVKAQLWTYNKNLRAIHPTEHFKNIPNNYIVHLMGDSNFFASQGGILFLYLSERQPVPEGVNSGTFYSSLERYKAIYNLETQELTKINSKVYPSHYKYARIGNAIYFAGSYPNTTGVQLLKVNLNNKKVSLVSAVNPSGDSNIQDVVAYNNKIIFSATDGVDPYKQLWSYDTQLDKTEKFVQKNSVHGTGANNFVLVDNKMYFSAQTQTIAIKDSMYTTQLQNKRNLFLCALTHMVVLIGSHIKCLILTTSFTIFQ